MIDKVKLKEAVEQVDLLLEERANGTDRASEAIAESVARRCHVYIEAARLVLAAQAAPGEVEAALKAFESTSSEPRMIDCARCNGRGFHHGFGEDGNDPDWCISCGGAGIDVVPGEEARAMQAALLAASLHRPVEAPMSERNNYWVSWYSPEDQWGKFELHSPWWVSGSRMSDDADIICAAIKAANEEDAVEQIYACHDVRPDNLEMRFCEPRDANWSPFNDRFPRGKWMKWEPLP